MKKIKLGIYKHYKGNYYEVIGIATHSETLEDLVLYKALYKSKEYGWAHFWVRPMEKFFEKKNVNGKLVPKWVFVARSVDDITMKD